MITKRILLATDFSPASRQLTNCIVEFKSLGLEEVVLVHVIDVRTPGGSSVSFQSDDKEMLEKKRSKLEEMGLKVKTIVPIGFPAQEIVRIAQEEDVSLIAIASHGEGFIKQVFLGSTTTDVIRISPLPVLVEKFRDVDKETCSIISQNKFKRVLVPLDFSIYSDKLVARLMECASLIDEVILLSVIERARNEKDFIGIQKETEQRLNTIRKDLEHMGLKVQTRVEQGSASRNIVEMAETHDVSLIVMGTRGEGMIKELLLGSTAHAVARRSSRSLLLIPPR